MTLCWLLTFILFSFTVLPFTFKYSKFLFCINSCYFNPVTLRKTKFICNFGLSECNRVNCQFVSLKVKYISIFTSTVNTRFLKVEGTSVQTTDISK